MIHKDKKTILLGCVYNNPNNRDPGDRGGGMEYKWHFSYSQKF